MTVIANVNSHPRILCFKNRISAIPRGKVKLLPKSGMAVGNVVLAVFPKIASIGIDHCRAVEIHAGHLFFVDRNHDYHAMFGSELLHHADGWAIWHALRQFIPARILLRTKIWTVEKLL